MVAHSGTLAASALAVRAAYRPNTGQLVFNHAFARELPRYDMRSKVAGIDVPTLLIVGREDHYKPQMEWLANELPDASLHVFPDVGHMPFLEKPDLFLNTVSTWKKS